MKKAKIMKITIIVLSILLVSSIIALAATLIYNHFNQKKHYNVTIPDHVINTPEEDEETNEDSASGSGDTSEDPSGQEESDKEAPSGEQPDEKAPDEGTDVIPPQNQGDVAASDPNAPAEPTEKQEGTEPPVGEGTEGEDATEGTEGEEDKTEEDVTALALQLHNKNPGDNIPFKVSNMFPGDTVTQYYCVKVSYSDVITMRFRADTRPGYEKLAEALKCKVVLMNTGKTLYNGTFKNMPTAVSYQLPESGETTTAELYYKITVYLETSTGNEYMNKSLIADFRWWVEETGNLKPPAQSGDGFNTYLWAGTAIAAAVVLIILKKKRRTL